MKRPRPGPELTEIERLVPLLGGVIDALESLQVSEHAHVLLDNELDTIRFVRRRLLEIDGQ